MGRRWAKNGRGSAPAAAGARSEWADDVETTRTGFESAKFEEFYRAQKVRAALRWSGAVSSRPTQSQLAVYALADRTRRSMASTAGIAARRTSMLVSIVPRAQRRACCRAAAPLWVGLGRAH
eukprot:SAG31_NODE_4557_length_3142_cov_1.739073_4_plen_122_part_00